MNHKTIVVMNEPATEEAVQELNAAVASFDSAVAGLKAKGAVVCVRLEHDGQGRDVEVFIDRQTLQIVLDYTDPDDENVMDRASKFNVSISLATLCHLLPQLQDAANNLMVHVINKQTDALNAILKTTDGQTDRPSEKP